MSSSVKATKIWHSNGTSDAFGTTHAEQSISTPGCINDSHQLCCGNFFESPIPEYSHIDPEHASYLNLVTFVVFLLEMILKILDKGLFWEHPQAYFRVGWNLLDFIVVLAQAFEIVSELGTGASNTFVKNLKVVRVLRPLRLVNRIKLLQVLHVVYRIVSHALCFY